MRLLLLSFYYLPDLSAGSFRCSALVQALKQICPELQIEILTTQPNRYRQSKTEALAFESDGNVRIHRFALPDHDSGMSDQARAFAAYSRQALRTLDGHYDAVFATSSRLMTAAFAAFVARRLKAPLYLDIRDLFADTMNDVLPSWMAKPSGPLIRGIERWAFRTASRINVVSEGFVDHIRHVAPDVGLRTYTNGIDDEFLVQAPAMRQRSPGEPLLIVYAGNIGEGQGLHRIIPDAARRLAGRARFRIIGHGGRMPQLRAELAGDSTNVELLPPVARSELHRHYADADILFLHLNDYPAFRKVLPSKVFEYAATGRPIVAGVAGYSARFIREHVANAQVFAPCDVEGMIAAIDTVTSISQLTDRTQFLERYTRRNITKMMAQDIIQFIEGNG